MVIHHNYNDNLDENDKKNNIYVLISTRIIMLMPTEQFDAELSSSHEYLRQTMVLTASLEYHQVQQLAKYTPKGIGRFYHTDILSNGTTTKINRRTQYL